MTGPPSERAAGCLHALDGAPQPPCAGRVPPASGGPGEQPEAVDDGLGIVHRGPEAQSPDRVLIDRIVTAELERVVRRLSDRTRLPPCEPDLSGDLRGADEVLDGEPPGGFLRFGVVCPMGDEVSACRT